MTWTTFGIGHPGFDTLNRYVDAELTAAQSRRVSAHVMACRRCRGITDGLNRLRADAHSLPATPVPPQLLERVLERRAAGERMILPTTDTAPKPHVNIARVSAAAALVMAVAGVFAVGGGRAVAAGAEGTGDLSFTPARPKPGDTLAVVYTAPEQLTHSEALVLRGRVVTGHVPEGVRIETPRVTRETLHRVAAGRFEGKFVFPSDAALAMFAVEDSGAQHVDSRRRRYWRLSAHDDSGRLTYAASFAATDEVSAQSWNARRRAAQELVNAFPDSLAAWRVLGFLNKVTRGESDTAVRALHRRMLEAFDNRAKASRTLSPAMVADLMWYATQLGDSTRRLYWRERLLRDAPRYPDAVQERANDIVMQHRPRAGSSAAEQRESWRRALARLDQLWTEVGKSHFTFATLGYQVSAWAEDPDGIGRWGPRYAEGQGGGSGPWFSVARDEVLFDSQRAAGMRLLRELLTPTDPVRDPQRPLEHTVAEYRADGVELRSSMLQRLGEALLAEGQNAAALDTLRLATQDGWNPARLRAIAEATLRAGDSVEAARTLALVAADPEVSPLFVDTVLAKLGLTDVDPRWTSARASAPRIMRERVLSTAVRRRLRLDSVHVTDATGRTRTLKDIVAGRVTIVAFGVELRGGSPVNIATMNRISATLAPDAQVVAIPIRPRTADADSLVRERGIRFGVYFDTASEMARAFNAYGFPMYFVIDAKGNLRFAYSSPRQLLAQAGALAAESVAKTR